MKAIPEIKDGLPYIDRDANLRIRGTANGKHPLMLTLTGPNAFHAKDFNSPSAHIAPTIGVECFPDIIQNSPLIPIEDPSKHNLRGQLVMTKVGDIGICFDIARQGTNAPEEPGRLLFLPKSGICRFHDRELIFACKEWEVIWRDTDGGGIINWDVASENSE